jgi:hypothetical protein
MAGRSSVFGLVPTDLVRAGLTPTREGYSCTFLMKEGLS